MPDVPMSFVIAFAPLFSKPVFDHVKVLLTGAILSPHLRTVSNALRVMGLSQEKHFQNYHRVLNRALRYSLHGSRILLGLLIKTFWTGGELVIGFDDTIERRWGKKIKARGTRSGCGQIKQISFCQNQWIAVALVYAFDASAGTGVGIAVFDCSVSVRKI